MKKESVAASVFFFFSFEKEDYAAVRKGGSLGMKNCHNFFQFGPEYTLPAVGGRGGGGVGICALLFLN